MYDKIEHEETRDPNAAMSINETTKAIEEIVITKQHNK